MSTLKKMLKRENQAPSELLISPRYEEYLARTPNIMVDERVGDFIKSEITTPQRNRRMTFSASARGACPREQVFQFTSVKPVPKLNSDLHAIFHMGTFIHLKWQALLLDAGILHDVEISCTDEELNMTGTLDGMGLIPDDHPLASHEEYGWELKSINSHGFRWVNDRGPNAHHLLQIHAYMLMTGWDVWSLVYEDKDTSQWKEFVVHRDPALIEQVQEELTYLNDSVFYKTLPPVLDECQKRQGAYRKCAFAHSCLEAGDWPERKIRL